MKKNIFFICALLSVLASCMHESKNAEDGSVTVHEDTVIISQASSLKERITLRKASLEDFRHTITVTGEVSPVPSQYARITSPFAGRVTSSRVLIGDHVLSGSVLFEVSSTAGSEIIKNFLQRKNEADLSRNALERTQDLFEHGIASRKELEEARTAYENACSELELAKSTARTFQVSLKEDEIGRPVTVCSPISGTILENDLVVGDYLREDATIGVTIADLSSVWVKANVQESDLGHLDIVDSVEIHMLSQQGHSFPGNIRFRGGILDPDTRSVQTVVECANPSGLLMPNMYVQVLFHTRAHQSVLIPKTSVLQSSKERYVLQETAPGMYLRTPVEVETADQDRYLVLSGLKGGENLITEGVYLFTDIK